LDIGPKSQVAFLFALAVALAQVAEKTRKLEAARRLRSSGMAARDLIWLKQ